MLIIVAGLFVSGSANAATLEDVKKSVSEGTGEMVHPDLYRELTDEEKEEFRDWPNPPEKINRKMTKEEADEYFRYVDEYQEKNGTNVVPADAYDYIQYIAEKLDASQTSEITDELCAEAQKHVLELSQDAKNEKSDASTKAKKKTADGSDTGKQQKLSLWEKFISFKWFG